jgi:cell division protein FtsB
MSTLLIVFAMIFVLGPIAKAYADRISRGLPPESESSRAELARLREEVDRLTTEVARLHDEQSFMVRLLSEGDRQRLLDRPDRVE